MKQLAQLQRIAIASSQRQDEKIVLTNQQQHYLCRVLRLREGDHFIAMDGQGQWWLAGLKETNAQILERILVQTELPVTVTLMAALPKGNGFDEVVRYCTELGVSCIIPVKCDRTLLNPSPQKLERWRRIATEAAEQSERQLIPTILEPVSFTSGSAIIDGSNTEQYICVARGNYPHLIHSLNYQQKAIAIATGPEGGWTGAEVEWAIASGFKPVSLGRRILRAVTAPVVALSLVAAALESSMPEETFNPILP